MCMIDYNDGDWEWIRYPAMRTARKAHACDECHRTIAKGERYEYALGKSDGRLFPQRTCEHCRAVTSWLMVWCNGYLYGAVLEDLVEHWDENWDLRGRYLAHAISGMRKRWTKDDGTLMRVMGTYKKPEQAVAA